MVKRLTQRFAIILRGHVLKSEHAVIAELLNLFDQVRIIRFSMPELVSSRVTGAMHVADDIQVLFNVADQVAFHDLHVITIEQHLQSIGTSLMTGQIIYMFQLDFLNVEI